MKNPFFTKTKSSFQYLEEKINKEHLIIQSDGLRMAKLFALKNQPDHRTGNLLSFVGPVKASYEKLVAEVVKELEPETQKKENVLEADYWKMVEGTLDQKIEDLKHQNHLALGEMEPDEKLMPRLKLGIILSSMLFTGELIMNGQSFQAAGGSLLSSYLIGFAVSGGVLLFSHGMAILYKKTDSVIKRRLILFGSIALVTTVFLASSMLRSQYLASQGTTVNPVYFTLFNLFFYIVSFLVALLLFPSIEAIKRHLRNVSLKAEIRGRNNQIDSIGKEKVQNAAEFVSHANERQRNVYSCKYFIQIIWKLFEETVGKMKQVNENSRQDGHSPDCFKESVPMLDLPKISFIPELPTK